MPKKYQIQVLNAATSPEILIHGPIGASFWSDDGITGKDFTDALNKFPTGTKVTVGVNSQGGQVKEGLAMRNAIARRSADITVRVDGYCMSAATLLPCAAGKVISPASSIWMIHPASIYTAGNATQLRKDAEMLDKHDDVLLNDYVTKSNGKKTEKELKAAMENETYLTGDEAVEWGLADEIGGEANLDTEAIGLPAVTATVTEFPTEVKKKISAALAAAKQNPAKSGKTESQNMDKKIIIALLLSHGIQAAETETEEQLQAKLLKIPKAAAPTVPAQPYNVTDIADLQKQVAAERKARITSAVTEAAAGKVSNEKLGWWVTQALADEVGVLAQLADIPVVAVASDPVGGHIEYGAETVLAGYEGRPSQMVANLFKEHKTPEARYQAMKENFVTLSADDNRRKGQVKAENTFSATITTNFLILGCTTKLGPKIASLKAFSKDNSTDPFKPLAVGVQKFNSTAQDGSTTIKNATTFGVLGDSTVAPVSITVDQYTEPLHLTNAQLNNGFRMDDLISAKMGSFGSKIMQVATTPITLANFNVLAALTRAPGAFGFSDLATLWGQLKKANTRNIVLDGEYLARLLNNPAFLSGAGGGDGTNLKGFGWDYCGLNTEWQGADAHVRGIACDPQAIGTISGLPLNPPGGIPGNMVQTGVARIAGADIGIAIYLWFDANTRSLCGTYDIMLGSALVDASAGVIIKDQ